MKYLLSLIFLLGACGNSIDPEQRAYDRLKAEQQTASDCKYLADCLGATGEVGQTECIIYRKKKPHIFISFLNSKTGMMGWACEKRRQIDEGIGGAEDAN